MENVFFDLQPIYGNWKIAFTREHDKEAGHIFQLLSQRQLIEIEKSIPMSTYNIIDNQKEWKYKSPFDFDALSWKDDIILGSINFSGGITNMVISPKLKKILENFHLPKHKFYSVKLTNIHNKESRDWFLLYMPDHPLQYVDWPSCEFKLKPSFKDKNKVPIEYLGPKVVASKEEFKILRSKYRNQNIKMFLEFHKIAYNTRYDVMWGNNNVLTISSNLKKEIISEKLKLDILERKELITVPN